MIGAGDTAVAQRVWRQRRSVAEKLRIVRLTFEPGASVAEVARKQGVNANQLFKWRRLFERGQLGDAGAGSTALLPVIVWVSTVICLQRRSFPGVRCTFTQPKHL